MSMYVTIRMENKVIAHLALVATESSTSRVGDYAVSAVYYPDPNFLKPCEPTAVTKSFPIVAFAREDGALALTKEAVDMLNQLYELGLTVPIDQE